MREFKYLVDSNVFLRPIVKDDSKKVRECEILFKKIKRGEIWAFTSNLVLAEIVWTSFRFYRIKKEEITNVLKGILAFKNLKIIDNFNPVLALKLYEDYPVKFIDCLIASNPQIFSKKVIVVSYDKDFDKLKVKRIEPSDLLKKMKNY